MVDQVSVQWPQPKPNQVSINTEALPSPAWVDSRVAQFVYGLGDILGKTPEELTPDIQRGNEGDLRRQAASTIDATVLQNMMDALKRNPQQIGTFMDKPPVPTDPNYVVEHSYAQRYVSKLDDPALGHTTYDEAQKEIPEYVAGTKAQTEELATKARKIGNRLQDAIDKYQDQSYLGWVGDYAKGLVPFYSQLKTTGKIGLWGNNLENFAMNWWRMPMSEFMEKFDPMIDKLMKDNPGEAITLLKSMYGMSQTDKLYHNVMAGVDVASIPGIASVPMLARKVGLFNFTRSAARDLLISQSYKESPEITAARGVGDLKGAAVGKASEAIQQEFKGKNPALSLAWDTLTSFLKLDMQTARANWGNASRELLTRIMDRYEKSSDAFMDLVMNSIRSERVPLHRATEEQIDKLAEEINAEYPEYREGQLEMTGPHQDPLTKAWHFELVMGTTKAKFFAKEEAAAVGAKMRGIKDAEVRGEGKMWKYVIKLPIPEDNPFVRDLSVVIPDAMPVHNWLNSFIGAIRNPGDTMAHDQMLNRIAASYGPTNFFRFFRDQVKEIQKIRGSFFKKKGFKDFEDLVMSGVEGKDDKGRTGRFFKGAADINEWMLRNKERVAHDAEIAAYFAFKRVVEMDRMLRQVLVNVNKDRWGAKRYQVKHLSKQGNVVFSPWFDARPVSEWPTERQVGALVINKEGRHSVIQLNLSTQKRLAEGFASGKVKVFELWQPYDKPLAKYARNKDPFKYVITDQYDRAELAWDSLPRREGGHFSYEEHYDHYVKEPIFEQDKTTGLWHYMGDRTLSPVYLKGQGQDYVKYLTESRRLIREGKLDEARALHESSFPDESWEDYHAGYYDKMGENYKPARMDLNARPYVVANNKTIRDVDPDLFKDPRFEGRVIDGTRGYSAANTAKIQFTGERDVHDLMSVNNIGTRQNPVFQFKAAEKLSPLPMMNRAWTRLINNFFIDDVKMSAIEAWATQARPYLKDHIAREVEYAPYRVYMEAGLNSFKNTEEALGEAKQMMFNKGKIDNFIGLPSKWDTFLWHTAQKLSDSIYDKWGPKWAIVPTKMLPFVKDPFRAMRSLAFNEKVGLFSIPQFMVHLTTYSTLVGVAGVQKAIPGTFAAFLHLWSLANPNILDHLDKLASSGVIRFGRPGEFKEALLLGRTTGFFRNEFEHAMQDSFFKNQIVQSGTHKFLNWGQFFFKAGLSSVRVSAWYTAYKEFRAVNPTKVITNLERLEILERADLLAHNMSRAHSSLLNRGVFSNTTQFYTYQQRLIEMMFPFFSTRLKTKEKIRLFSTNMLLFGFPIAAATTPAGILPVADHIKQTAAEHGFVMGDNFLSSMFMGGALDQIGALVNGRGDWTKGEHYNWGGRYGTKGLEWANNMREDEHLWEWFLGASYQTGINTWTEMDGLIRAGMSGIKSILGIEQPEGEVYPLTVDVLIRPFREVSSINTWERFREAVNTGNWISKQGRILEGKVTAGEALWMSLSGLQRQSTEDIFAFSKARKSEKAYMDDTRRLLFTAMSGYYNAMNNNDPDQAKQYHLQAMQILVSRGYPDELVAKVFGEAAKANMPLAQTIPLQWYSKDVPHGRKEQADKARQDWERVQQNKGYN